MKFWKLALGACIVGFVHLDLHAQVNNYNILDHFAGAINGATIDNSVIGGTTPANGTFTNLKEVDAADTTKVFAFTAVGNTTGKTGTLASAVTLARTWTLPDITDTLSSKASTDVFTNKTYDTAGAGNVFKINGTGISAISGTGSVCMTVSCVMTTPQLGTPTSGVMTNVTGTASGLTAGNVTTNANLTGPITSVGNATAIAAQTGTGSTFVMSAGGPTIDGGLTLTNGSVQLDNATNIAMKDNGATYRNVLQMDASNNVNLLSNGASGTIQFKISNTTKLTVNNAGNTTAAGTLAATGGFVGVAGSGAAAAGNIGEVITASLAVGSATSLVTATTKTIASVSLTAGAWDCTGVGDMHPGATTNATLIYVGISTTNNTLGADDTYAGIGFETAGRTTSLDYRMILPTQRFNFGSTTTVYMVEQATFTVSTMTGYGTLRCTRVY